MIEKMTKYPKRVKYIPIEMVSGTGHRLGALGLTPLRVESGAPLTCVKPAAWAAVNGTLSP
jgi:hypothetical protein